MTVLFIIFLVFITVVVFILFKRKNAGRAGGASNLGSIHKRQMALQSLGFYHGPLDDQWGTEVMEALRAFQEENGLASGTGWNKETEQVLINALKE